MAIPARIQNHECSSQSSQDGAVELYACLSDIVKLLLIVELVVSGLIWLVSVRIISGSIELFAEVIADLKGVVMEPGSVVDSSKFSSRSTAPVFDGCATDDFGEVSAVLSLSKLEISVVETVLFNTVVDKDTGDDVISMIDGVTGSVFVLTGEVNCLVTDC